MKIWSMLNYRVVNMLLVLVSALGMAFALYLQYIEKLEPCPLCVFQRVGLIGLGVIALVAVMHNPVKALYRRFYAFLMLLSIGWSFGVAARHVWLQHLPADEVPACGPGLDYWLEAFPFQEVLNLVLSGSGECAKVSWTLFSLSIPTWSVMFFGGLMLVVLMQLLKPLRN